MLELFKKDLLSSEREITLLQAKPFDYRHTFFTGTSRGFHTYPAITVNKHVFMKDNIVFITTNQAAKGYKHVFVSKTLSSRPILDNSGLFGTGRLFPLYLYPETNAQQTIDQSEERKPNLKTEIVNQIAEKLGMEFVSEKNGPLPPTPLNLPIGETLPPPHLNLPIGETFSPPHLNLPIGETLPPPLSNKLIEKPEVKDYEEDVDNISRVEEVMPGYVTANPQTYKWIKEFRKKLKDNPTEAEKIMWQHLRNKQLGHKIRRQHIIGDFITDFVCLRKKLVIEIDGKIHEQQKEYDALRTACLNDWGYSVIRFTNEAVFANPESVAASIKLALDQKEDLQTDPEENTLKEDEETYSTESDLNLNTESGGDKKLNSRLVGGGDSPSGGQGVSGGDKAQTFAPIDILDYIYAVLHSPTYREKYKEFLKIDFPRVPYPKDAASFWQLVKLGGEIRQIHLLESSVVEKYITQYPEDGNNVVLKPIYKNGHVYINETQYFANVPQVAWEFYIGGYQPAQKWLKDRKDRKLEFEDILHYQKIIVALTETDRLMKEVDKIKID